MTNVFDMHFTDREGSAVVVPYVIKVRTDDPAPGWVTLVHPKNTQTAVNLKDYVSILFTPSYVYNPDETTSGRLDRFSNDSNKKWL